MSSLPRRLVCSSRVISLRVLAFLVVGGSSLVLSGCPGELDPHLMTTGTGGTGGPAVCDGAALMVTKCGMPGCHGSSQPQGGLDLSSKAGLGARLLGQNPAPGTNAFCTDNLRSQYLVPQSSPAMGFLLAKLVDPVPCGTIMPQLGTLTAADLDCIRAWSTAVTTGQPVP